MKNQIHTNLHIRAILVLALILSTGYLSACSGQRTGAPPAALSPVETQSVEAAQEKSMAEAKMMERCMEMKQQKQKMMEDMKVQDTELSLQLARMNSAKKNGKAPLMAAVITTMVEQRIARDARKAKMEEEMMQHMMQHMQMGKDSMAQCPMMKDMKDMKGMDHKSMDTKKE